MAIAARMPTIRMTTSSSIRVKPPSSVEPLRGRGGIVGLLDAFVTSPCRSPHKLAFSAMHRRSRQGALAARGRPGPRTSLDRSWTSDRARWAITQRQDANGGGQWPPPSLGIKPIRDPMRSDQRSHYQVPPLQTVLPLALTQVRSTVPFSYLSLYVSPVPLATDWTSKPVAVGVPTIVAVAVVVSFSVGSIAWSSPMVAPAKLPLCSLAKVCMTVSRVPTWVLAAESLALLVWLRNAGMAIAARMPTIRMTTSSSIRVKPPSSVEHLRGRGGIVGLLDAFVTSPCRSPHKLAFSAMHRRSRQGALAARGRPGPRTSLDRSWTSDRARWAITQRQDANGGGQWPPPSLGIKPIRDPMRSDQRSHYQVPPLQTVLPLALTQVRSTVPFSYLSLYVSPVPLATDWTSKPVAVGVPTIVAVAV